MGTQKQKKGKLVFFSESDKARKKIFLKHDMVFELRKQPSFKINK